MNIQPTTPYSGRRNAAKRTEKLTQENTLKKLLEEHKKSIGETIWIKIDDRTHIEVPVGMSIEEREKRVKNYIKNTVRK